MSCRDCIHLEACLAWYNSEISCGSLVDDRERFVKNEGCDLFKLDTDVVEVVRCKDCIYYESNCCFNRQWDFESSSEVPMVRENDFCSYGERRSK